MHKEGAASQLSRLLVALPVRGCLSPCAMLCIAYPLYFLVRKYRWHPFHDLKDMIGLASEGEFPPRIKYSLCGRVSSAQMVGIECRF
jgi:hypothetical protein